MTPDQQGAVYLAACLITKDAAPTIERCVVSIRQHVDEINVYDTGSSDETLAILARLSAATESGQASLRVESGEWRDDFSWARERSFAMASSSATWLVWLDADDEIVGAEQLRELAREADPDTDGFVFYYDYSRDAAGNTTAATWRERLLRRSADYRWFGRIHETLQPSDGRKARLATVPAERTRWVHGRSGEAPDTWRNRNLRLLRLDEQDHLERGERVPARTLLYLGLEYKWQGDFDRAAEYLRRYLSAAERQPGDEAARRHAILELAACARHSGDIAGAIELARPVAEAPGGSRLGALVLAETYAAAGDWSAAELWATRALEAGQSTFATSPLRLAVMPWVRQAEARLMRGDEPGGLAALRGALDAAPSDLLATKYDEVTQALDAGDRATALRSIREVAARYDDEVQSVVRGLRLQVEPSLRPAGGTSEGGASDVTARAG